MKSFNKTQKQCIRLQFQGIEKKSQKDKPLITVITVVYNGEKFLEETIKSVINQTYDNLEYIIIDGGSSDSTLEIIKRYESQIDYWVSEPDNGIYDAMNKGISLATGDWINFMNAGDMFYSNSTLASVLNYLQREYTFVYGDTALFFDDIKRSNIIKSRGKLIHRNLPYCHQSLFARVDYLKTTKFDLKLKISADYDQYLNAKYSRKSFNKMDIVVCYFRAGGVSQSKSASLRIYREYFESLKKYNFFMALGIYFARRIKSFIKTI
ncbi:glycosyltransferase [Allofrancisella frigidaquae]|uniref:Glycosyltransferase n=2 Tax=Allofrancisella frigidaquae TaxID=1085644 RepID=A0A6M3HVX1_9GAMM|nr:glycosyltransferase [Allofrancisella frigidaquae]